MKTLLDKLITSPEQVEFAEVIQTIEQEYCFTPAAFKNGDTYNGAGENNGSCKIFAFAKINGLSEQQTLQCFGDYYRIDVLQNPDGQDHANIRNFIKYGWQGIEFESDALETR